MSLSRFQSQTDRNPKIGQTMINQVKVGGSKRGSDDNNIAVMIVPTFKLL